MFLRMIALLLPLSLLGAGCSGDDTDKATKTCPAGGIGVKAPNGTSCSGILDTESDSLKACQEQMANYEDYACKEPQMCPDQGSYQIPHLELKKSEQGAVLSYDQLPFTLTNCSTGAKPLVISKVELTGDARCSFRFDPNTDVAPSLSVKPGETTLLHAVYKPKELGEDHGHLRVYTNAQNIPTLVLPICGRAVASSTTSTDAGTTSAEDASVKPNSWRCKSPEEAGTTVLPCHQPQSKQDGGTGTGG